MNKLICSLRSDLPNEVEFAIQTSIILANSENFTWRKDYPLVDAICGSLHVFTCVCEGTSSTCLCFPRFWHEILTRNSDNVNLEAATLPPDMELSFLDFKNLKHHDFDDFRRIYRRVKIVAELLKQLSMTACIPRQDKDQNFYVTEKKRLKASPSLLKFVSLLLHCDDASFNSIGLEILSNTASKLAKVPESINDVYCTKLVQMFMSHCTEAIRLQDGDIYVINKSMEIVSRLISSSSKRVSSGIIGQIIDKNLVLRVEQLLTSHHDVRLFLSALEFCHRISRHHPLLLTAGGTRHLLKLIIILLNCDDNRYFTPSALKRIRLIDEDDSTVQHLTPLTKPRINLPPQAQPRSQTQNSLSVQPRPITTPAVATAVKNPTIINNISSTNHVATTIKSSNPTPAATTAPSAISASHAATNVTVPVEPTRPKEISCEWDGCNSKFEASKDLINHVFERHIGPLPADAISSCLWSGPNGTGPGCATKRPKYSLLTHLNDFHCNPNGRVQPVKPPEHPGYAPNAALLAIKRHANSHMTTTKSNHNQSPLSISVRLTAALILRNLVSESPEVKQALENHEPLISEICMTNGRDESKILAECLSLLSN